MRIAIIGYGKMGKEIEAKAQQMGHIISRIIDVQNTDHLLQLNSSDADVVIEFTRPDSVIQNIFQCFENGIPIITGTTGWYDDLNVVKDRCIKKNGTLFYAPNFSIGVNLLLEFTEFISKKLSKYPEYKVHIEETHHTQKLDSPSGTAISIASKLLSNHSNFSSWRNEANCAENELPIISYRLQDVTGEHKLIYESEQDTIELIHNAKSRSGFAIGAIKAAEFVENKKGVYTMTDLINN